MRIINLLNKGWLALLLTLICCMASFYYGCSYISNPSSYTLYPLSAESNTIYLTNSLDIEAALKIKIEKNTFINKKGMLNIFRDNKAVNEIIREKLNNKSIKKFQLLPNDKICIDSFCQINEKEIVLFSIYNELNNSTIATSSFAFIKASYFPVNNTIGIMSDNSGSYILLNNHNNHIQYIDRLTNDARYYVNYEKSGYSIKKIGWLSLSTLLLGVFLLFVFLNYKKLYIALLKNNLIFAIPFTVYIVFIYLTVFPAIFAGDNVLMAINEGSFTTWYSATYMVYSYLVYFLGQQFIILPTLILFWASTLYLVNSSRYISKKIYIFVCCYICLFLLFSPYMLVSVYGVQRFFTAAIAFISGLQFIFSGYLRRSKDEQSYTNVIKFGTVLVILACAMRIEYCIVTIIFIFTIARYFNLATVKKSILHSFSVCAIALLMEFILSITLSSIYSYDLNAHKRDYKLITLINLTDAYSQCPALEKNYIDEVLAPQMSLTEICNLNVSFEEYFWQKISKLDVSQREELYHKITSTLPEKITQDPVKMVKHIIIKAYFLIHEKVWSIGNKYTISHFNPHVFKADAMHLLDYNIFGKTIYNKVMAYYHALGTYNLFYQVTSLILIFIIYPISFGKNSVCRLTNLSVMALFCFIMLAAPSFNQWGYLVFIPIWCYYSIIFVLFEREIRKPPVSILKTVSTQTEN